MLDEVLRETPHLKNIISRIPLYLYLRIAIGNLAYFSNGMHNLFISLKGIFISSEITILSGVRDTTGEK